MLRFCSLGSGSTGNATLVEAGSGSTVTRLLIDCGFSLRELTLRLSRTGLGIDDIDAVFVTHEHGDHVGCALTLARRHQVPLWTSLGTWRAIGEESAQPWLNVARDGEAIALGDLQLRPYTVPHDANEPLQLRLSDGDACLGVLTDIGSSTAHVIAHLQGCDALLLECNHDLEMLANSSYPASLKRRVGGRLGHLSNDTAAEILAACHHARLRHLVAAHLSRQNNRPELAVQALLGVTGGNTDDIIVADPALGFEWLSLR